MLDHDDFTTREAEALREHGFTTEHAIYNAVGELYLDLNETELQLLVGQLNTSLASFQREALRVAQVRQALYRQYNKRARAYRATSVFSAKFNKSIKAHNEKIMVDVDQAFRDAALADKNGHFESAITILSKLGLRQSVLFNQEIIDLVQAHSALAFAELVRIRQFRGTLFRTIVPLAASIGRQQSLPLKSSGTTLDFPDMLQEAFIAAMQTLEYYRPISGGKTLTSFIFTAVNGVVKQRKAELSRNVAIPRPVYDRFNYIQRAAEEEMADLNKELTFEEIQAIKVRASKYTRKPFTTEEVQDLLQVMQSESSLNVEMEDEDGVLVQVGDLIEGETDLDKEFDKKYALTRLLTLLKKFCADEQQFEVLKFRWANGDVKDYATAARAYWEHTGKPMNKTVAANIERQVFDKIRKAAIKDPKLKQQFAEIQQSLA